MHETSTPPGGPDIESPLLTPESALAAARDALPWMIAIRRDLHQHPELGLEEHRTAGRVQALLDELGIPHTDGIGETGVLGVIGSGDGPVVALRADLDALPMQDAKENAPYRSKVPGKMHACGHDVHTAVLLGAAKLLVGLGDALPGTVKLLFQPAEETVGGAQLMIEAGVLDDPRVEAVFGLHVDADFELGSFGVRYGQRNASSDSFTLTVHGRSCHAAYPAGGVDAIVVAAQLVGAVQTIVGRNVDARDAAVISIGTIEGGTQANIMADRVTMTGTVRTLDPAVRERVLERLRTTVEGVAAGFGAHVTLDVARGYEPLINHDAMVDVARANAGCLVGEERVTVRPQANMGVEDFAFYLREVPGAFFTLGVGNRAKGIVHPVHQVRFDVDEECMAYGAAVQAMNALTILTRVHG